MPKVYKGTHLFLKEAEKVLADNLQDRINTLKKSGIDGVVIKFADGDLDSDPASLATMNRFLRLVGPFKKSGLKVGGLIYQYLYNVDGEAKACFQAINAGADWIVLDVKSDVAKKPFSVLEFGQLVRSKYPGIILGLTSYPIADNYPDIPFDQYLTFTDVILPQIYWTEMGSNVTKAFKASVSSYSKYDKPIVPVGQASKVTAVKDMDIFAKLCNKASFTGISWGVWPEISTKQLEVIRANRSTKSQHLKKHKTASDVKENSWYAKAVDFVLQMKIMSTDEAGNFYPDQLVTREKLANVIYNMVKFKTISKHNEKINAIEFVLHEGIMSLDKKGDFKPKQVVTRGMLAKVVMTAEPIVANPLKAKPNPSSSPRDITAKDVSTSQWYAKAVKFVLAEGIMTVDRSGIFHPKNSVTNAMLAQVIFNVIAY